jgi:hypothetical protein
MKTLAKWITCGAALVAVIGPADASVLCGRHLREKRVSSPGPATDIPNHVLEDGAGLGTGGFRIPATGSGSASLQLYDETGRLAYLVHASLVRSGEVPPAGEPEQGGFHGELILIEADGSQVPVAVILGKWIREVDGSGTFGVDILVRTELPEEPLVAIGTIAGELRARRPSTDPTGSPGLRKSAVTALGRVAATWVVAQ